jgi:hypothetical protein
MSIHSPYGPPAPQAAGDYPTAPPWATVPQAAQSQASQVPAQRQYVPHGRLMVPFPEAMYQATLPEAPAWWPVVAFTAVSGPFGAISAARRAHRARLHRRDRYPYWLAYALTLVVLVAPLTYYGYVIARDVVRAMTLDENVRHEPAGLGLAAGTTVRSADCRPAGSWRADGTRVYACAVELGDGRTEKLAVAANGKGAWRPAG